MRILLGAPNLDMASGGLSALVSRMAAELASLSHQVALAYAVDPAQLRLPAPSGVELVEYPYAGLPWQLWWRARHRLDRWIAGHRLQCVHDYGLWRPENLAMQSTALAHRVPLLIQPCGMLLDWAMTQSRLKKQLALALYQRRLLAGSAAVLVTSDGERQETGARLPPGCRLESIPHGVELPPPSDRPRQRRAVFLGRLHPVKQLDLVLRAWAELRPADWRLDLAGPGESDYLRDLQRLTDQLGLGDRVRFLGPLQGEAKHELLAGSQLYLQPSLQENFGLAIAEALAHGLPVLTSHHTPWEALETERCGWWVAGEQAAVTAALREALSLPAQTLAEMGARARQLAGRYSWRESALRTVAVYEAVADHR